MTTPKTGTKTGRKSPAKTKGAKSPGDAVQMEGGETGAAVDTTPGGATGVAGGGTGAVGGGFEADRGMGSPGAAADRRAAEDAAAGVARRTGQMRPAESAEGPAYGPGLHDAIARRAYELWEAEGRPAGRHDEHWRRAEEEIRRQRGGRW
jgi:Protein of unknown function (DUF2934)